MKTKTEIERAIITLLCEAYDKGTASTGYCSLDDTKRDKWVKNQLANIEKWYIRDNKSNSQKEEITNKWLLNHNFDNFTSEHYSYQGGGKDFSFMVEKKVGKWFAEIGDGFTDNPTCGLEYAEEIEDIFFLLTGKGIDKKQYKKPQILAGERRYIYL